MAKSVTTLYFDKDNKLQVVGDCEVCGDSDFSPNVEAFELSGKIVCDECADEIFEDNSQFGVGA